MKPSIALTCLVFAVPAHAEDVLIYRPIPGTSVPDYGGPAQVLRGDTLYPVLPGTRTPDYGSNNRIIIRGGKAYPVLPGTNTPDYGKAKRVWR